MFPFFVIGIFILIQVPASLCADEDYYLNCSRTYQCVNMSIGYPFWGPGRLEYCGYPGFELNCQGDAPQITSGTTNYSVLGIDSLSQTLNVARVDYWNTVCPQYLFNTTFDFNLFRYSSTVQNLMLYYGCTTVSIPGSSSNNEFSCNSTDTIGYYLTGNTTITSPVSCNNSVVVPISQTAAQTLETNPAAATLTAALNGGFELQWIANNALCDQCAISGGQCGYNQTRSAFICHCPLLQKR